MKLDYPVPVFLRLIGFGLILTTLSLVFDLPFVSSEALLILAIGFTILDRQQDHVRGETK